MTEQSHLIGYHEAGALAGGTVRRLSTETVSLAEAFGRISAVDVLAPFDLPGFANSAMDGYALRAADLADRPGKDLPVAATILAGDTDVHVLPPGMAMAIMTGAPLPEGADTVVIREEVVRDGDRVRFESEVSAAANIRPADDDCASGTRVLAAGERLDAGRLAWLAALGIDTVSVVRRPRVAIVVTGDELVAPGQPRGHGQRYESNGVLLHMLAREAGADVIRIEAVGDQPARLRQRLRELAMDVDLLISSGGVSAGDADHLPAVAADLGEIVFHKVRIRPGMPVLCARVDDCVLMGLPGNPVSVGVTFKMLVQPLIERMLGRSDAADGRAMARLARDWPKKHRRLEFLRVRLAFASDGVLIAEPFRHQGSGALSVLAQADGVAVLPEEPRDYREGDPVEVRLWRMPSARA